MENNKPLFVADYVGTLCDYVGVHSDRCMSHAKCYNCAESSLKDYGLTVGHYEVWPTIEGAEENIVLFLLKHGN